MIQLIQFAVDGVLVGGTYALLAAGLALIFGVMRVVNFAQADFMMLAMYFAYLMWRLGLDPLLCIPIAFLVFFALGWAVERSLISRVTGMHENTDAQVVLTLGLGLVLENAVLIIFSATPMVVAPPYANHAWRVLGLFIDQARFASFVVAATVAIALFIFLQLTAVGRAIRAVAADWEAATYMGIDIGRARAGGFALGIGLTSIGGVMLATFQPISPFVGLDYIVIMFVAVILGGLGSTFGAVAGGLLVGFVQSVSQYWSPSSLSNVYVFVLLLLILYLRPHGIFGRAGRVV